MVFAKLAATSWCPAEPVFEHTSYSGIFQAPKTLSGVSQTNRRRSGLEIVPVTLPENALTMSVDQVFPPSPEIVLTEPAVFRVVEQVSYCARVELLARFGGVPVSLRAVAIA